MLYIILYPTGSALPLASTSASISSQLPISNQMGLSFKIILNDGTHDGFGISQWPEVTRDDLIRDIHELKGKTSCAKIA